MFVVRDEFKEETQEDKWVEEISQVQEYLMDFDNSERDESIKFTTRDNIVLEV